MTCEKMNRKSRQVLRLTMTDCPHKVRKGDAHRQRLSEEESSLYSCVVGQFEHYFDTFWIVHSWLWGETFRLPLLLLFQCLKLKKTKKNNFFFPPQSNC